MAKGASNFYQTSQPRRQTRCFVTLLEAFDQAFGQSSETTDVVVLPPASGDLAIDSDVEQFSEDGLDGDDTFEPTGELEVEMEESS